MRYYLLNDNSIQIELFSMPRTKANTDIGGGGLIDQFIDLGFDLENPERYIYMNYDALVNIIFDKNFGKTIIKTKLIGDFNAKKLEYESEYGQFFGDRFELNEQELKQIINDF